MPDYPFELGENEQNLKSESFRKCFKGKEMRALGREVVNSARRVIRRLKRSILRADICRVNYRR